MDTEHKVLVEIGYEKFLLPCTEVQKFIDLMEKMIPIRCCWEDHEMYYQLQEESNFSISNAKCEVRKGDD